VPPTPSLQRFQGLLRDLFQFDLSDLDFGLYRLLRLKREEVEAFLTEQLPRRVEEAFREAAGGERAALQQQLARKADEVRANLGIAAIQDDGTISPAFAATPMAQQYELIRMQLQAAEASEAQKADVFNHLFAFFSRYYDSGDFVPRRYYGAREHFAVPYNGEETVFTWANRGQHYVKTGEVFRDYTFAADAGLEGEFRVRFTLTAADVLAGNTKGDTRYFFPLPGEAQWRGDARTWIVPFHYRLPSAAEAERLGRNGMQDAILDEALPALLEAAPDPALRTALAEAPANEREDPLPSLIVRRMRHFTRRNTSDYFIHRDLRRFLLRELEFYIKDQVLHLGDLEADLPAKLRVLRTVRALAEEVTGFLSHLEEVQRRLFEKRKLVLRTDWLVLIKDVPRELWPEVLRNEAQLRSWQELFAIDPAADLLNPAGEVNEQFLADHPTLVVNSEHFTNDPTFVDRLLAGIDGDLDELTGGVLIQSENYQALRLLQRRYAGDVQSIYLDPPYNTGTDNFVYKDRYQHSSWLTMMEERLQLGGRLLAKAGVLSVSLNDIESANLSELIAHSGISLRALGPFVWKTRNTDNRVLTRFSVDHEYIHVFIRPGESLLGRIIDRSSFKNPDNDPRGPYTTDPLTGKANAKDRPNLHYTIVNHDTGDAYPPHPDFGWITDEAGFEDLRSDRRVYWPKNPESGKPRKKRFLWETSERAPIGSLGIKITQGEGNQDLADILGFKALNFPKPVSVIRSVVEATTGRADLVVDYFAGSGTTGQAVIEMNRSDDGQRRFILVEMGEYFRSILVPRIQRILYAPEWTDGKPYRQPNADETARTPSILKVLHLESYEDALHNLTTEQALQRAEPRANAFRAAVGEDAYRLRYLAQLPLEANASLLHVDRLERPFHYSIEVLNGGGAREETVDLVETFNLAYGLHVERRERWTNPAEEERVYRVVCGRDRRGQRVLVIWRDIEGLDPAAERGWLETRIADTGPWDDVLCNADSAIPGVRSLDPDFKRLMSEPEEGL
jgi:adenine-specific DNA-methyltransferase